MDLNIPTDAAFGSDVMNFSRTLCINYQERTVVLALERTFPLGGVPPPVRRISKDSPVAKLVSRITVVGYRESASLELILLARRLAANDRRLSDNHTETRSA